MNKSKVYSHIANGLKPLYEPYRKQGKQFIVLFKNRQAKAIVPFDQYEKQLVRYEEYKTLSKELKNDDAGAFEEMFSNNLPPKNKDITRYLNVIMKNKPDNEKAILQFITLDNKIKYLTLTEGSKKSIKEYLKSAYQANKLASYGSDAIDNFMTDGFKEVSFKYLTPSKKQQVSAENNDGQYFNAVNTTTIDLSQYQIHGQEYFEAIKEQRAKDPFYEENITHCIIHTLEQSGVPHVKIQRILTSFNDCFNFPISKLQNLATAVERSIYLYTYDTAGDIRCKKYIVEGSEPIKMALYKNHYFIYNDTRYTKYSLQNYNEINKERDFQDIYRKERNSYRRSKDRCRASSLEAVKIMNDLKMFDWNNKVLLNYRVSTKIDNILDIPLEDIENEQKLNETQKIKPRGDIFIADLESIVKHGTHKPFMSGIIKRSDDKVKYGKPLITISKKPDCYRWFYKMMDYVADNSEDVKKQEPIIYFHNLKYDLTIMLKKLKIYYSVKKDGQYYEIRATYWKDGKERKIKMRDSYKMISKPLCKFQEMFQLKNKKEEAINYTHYDYENLGKKNNVKKYKKGFSEKNKKIFDKIMSDEKNAEMFEYKGKTFNALAYYRYYLNQDVMTLYEGLDKFNELMRTLTNLDSYNYLTISKLAFEFFNSRDCFEGVHMCNGNLRTYLSLAVYGGRVNVQQSIKKMIIDETLNDYDANSLYPSAFDRMCEEGTGLSKGKAKVITEEHKQYDNLKKLEYYIVTVKINAIKKKQDNPFTQVKNKDDISDYVNELPDGKPIITTIDKITLEDYIKFHEIEYEILKGVYYDGGFNNSIGPICKELYVERLRIKKDNPAMAEIIKLILNSTYGKTISKKNFEKIHYVPKGKFNNFVYKNYANITGMIHKLNDNLYEITTATIDDSYNFASVGVKCLSFSKRIMNEVMGLASDNGILIYYQDTDSMHLKDSDIPRLEELYRINYNNKELHGNGLGQFKSDFKFLDEDGNDLNYKNVKSIRSCFLGKKAYLDELRGYDKEGKEHIDYHIRLKGVTEAGINYKIDEVGAIELYRQLAEGNKIEFIMNPTDHKVMFEFTKNSVHTRETRSFVREVCF